eukprot:scpid74400/ scgid16824/ 
MSWVTSSIVMFSAKLDMSCGLTTRFISPVNCTWSGTIDPIAASPPVSTRHVIIPRMAADIFINSVPVLERGCYGLLREGPHIQAGDGQSNPRTAGVIGQSVLVQNYCKMYCLGNAFSSDQPISHHFQNFNLPFQTANYHSQTDRLFDC